MDSSIIDALLTFGVIFWIVVIIAAILLFFLPFYVAGIYNQSRQTATLLKDSISQLQQIKREIRAFRNDFMEQQLESKEQQLGKDFGFDERE